jgi:hypothetical protein
VPLVLCILGLALYPQLILKRTDTSAQQSVSATREGPTEARLALARSHTGHAHMGVTEVTIVQPNAESSK